MFEFLVGVGVVGGMVLLLLGVLFTNDYLILLGATLFLVSLIVGWSKAKIY